MNSCEPFEIRVVLVLLGLAFSSLIQSELNCFSKQSLLEELSAEGKI